MSAIRVGHEPVASSSWRRHVVRARPRPRTSRFAEAARRSRSAARGASGRAGSGRRSLAGRSRRAAARRGSLDAHGRPAAGRASLGERSALDGATERVDVRRSPSYGRAGRRRAPVPGARPTLAAIDRGDGGQPARRHATGGGAAELPPRPADPPDLDRAVQRLRPLRPRLKRISHSTVDDFPWIFHAVLVGSLLLLGLLQLASPSPSSSCIQVLSFFGAARVVAILACRARGSARCWPRVLAPERVLFVGDGSRSRACSSARSTCPPRVRARADRPRWLAGSESERIDGVRDTEAPRRSSISVGARARRPDAWWSPRGMASRSALLDACCDAARELDVKVSVLPQLFEALGPVGGGRRRRGRDGPRDQPAGAAALLALPEAQHGHRGRLRGARPARSR